MAREFPGAFPGVDHENSEADFGSQGIIGDDWDWLLDQGGGSEVQFGVGLAGPVPFERNQDQAFLPASNTKLFTAGAILATLGPDYRIPTELQWKAKGARAFNLRVIGHGDPSWERDRVRRFAQALWERGIREVEGPVEFVSADSRWDELRYPPGWELEDRTECYGALPQAFNVALNCAAYVVTGLNQGHWDDPLIPTQVELDLHPGAKTELIVEAIENENDPEALPRGYRISGTWKLNSLPVAGALPVLEPRIWAQNLFLRALLEEGIAILPRGPSPAKGGAQSVRFLSPPLSAIMKPFLKQSINLIGESFLKVLGEKVGSGRTDLYTAGRDLIRRYTADLGIWSDVHLADGSGLSRASHVTPRAMMILLEDLKIRAYFPVLWDALSVAGVDGTLRNRMKGTPAQGVLRGKTGTLRGSYNLSGYIPRLDPSGKPVAYFPFVILSETHPKNRGLSRAAQDRVGSALSSLINQ